MARAINLQTFGAVIVLLAFVAAELAVRFLAASPGSPLAWSLNMGLFRVFEQARAEPSPLRFLFGPASLAVALAALGFVLAARLLRLRLAVAFAANLSFGFAVALAHAGLGLGRGAQPATASLAPATLTADGFALPALLLGISFAAFAASHASFLSAIMSERLGRRG